MARHHRKLNKCPNCETPLRVHDNFCPDSLSKKDDLEDYWRIDIALPVDSVQRRHLIEKLKELTDNEVDSLLENKSIAKTTENRSKLRSAINLVPNSSSNPMQLEVGGIKIYFSSFQDRDTFTKNLKNFSRQQLDSTLVALHVKRNSFNRTALKQVSKFDLQNESFLQNLTHVFMKNLSFIMFILMPVVACLLLWVF